MKRTFEAYYSGKKRKQMAKAGLALPDGSFPIGNAAALANAIKLAGNAKNPKKARKFIIRRATILGRSDMIPDSWKKVSSR